MATPKGEVEGQYAVDSQKDNDVGLKEQVESQGTSQELPKPLEQTSSTEVKSKFTSWAKGLKMPSVPTQGASMESAKSAFGLFTGSFIKRAPGKIPVVDATEENTTPQAHDGALGTFTKGFLDTSKNAMKAVQTRARHLVSQNKRRYQEGGFDLDMSYITENIIAMGFPAGDMSSGLLGYVEGFYRNHMEEVIKFFETRHKDKYKVYNLCSERLYDPSLLEGKVACFPFDDHNCPPLQLVMAFCQSAYSWLKGDLANVVVVHCKAGMARTGLMISCLLLYLKFFPTAEESISHYNQMRCVDSKGLVLPSQLRYVKYFERVLKDFAGETPSGRKCILRGIRLHKCPYWIRPSITVSDHSGVLFSTKKHSRTKDMMPEDFWFSAPRKGIMVFALPGERCVADLNGDFKINFQDRQGDFYCWLNTNMMENRQLLKTSELDGFDKRRVPSPGFQVEVVILDSDATPASRVQHAEPQPASDEARVPQASQAPDREKDDVFSDSESEEADGKSKLQKQSMNMKGEENPPSDSLLHNTNISQESGMPSKTNVHDIPVTGKNNVAEGDEDKKARDDEHKRSANPMSGVGDYEHSGLDASAASSDFKSLAVASAADASVFTFGDDEDFESEEE